MSDICEVEVVSAATEGGAICERIAAAWFRKNGPVVGKSPTEEIWNGSSSMVIRKRGRQK